jgi:hypothetical protein
MLIREIDRYCDAAGTEHHAFNPERCGAIRHCGIGRRQRFGCLEALGAKYGESLGLCPVPFEDGAGQQDVAPLLQFNQPLIMLEQRILFELGLDYVSASPFRVPVARLSAAQVSLRNLS